MLRDAFWEKLADVDGMVGVAAYAHHFSVSYAEFHAASDGAIAAGALDPSIGVLALRGVAEDGVMTKAIFRGKSVDTAFTQYPLQQTHAASMERYSVAMLLGTTLTKKR